MKRLDFTIQEAGCLLYVADSGLGGLSFGELYSADWKDLTLKNALIATSLYQDDGYSVRVVLGDLSAEEQTEWTANVSWKLDLESGKMVVSGVCDEDLDEYSEDFPVAETNGDYHLGCFVEIPNGVYRVNIYSYPPNDLSGGWMAIEDARSFRTCFGRNSDFKYEKPLDYFKRTRRGETPPAWIEDGFEDARFLDFLIQLQPLSENLEIPEFEDGDCLLWQYRKPEICPVGIRI